MKEKIKLMVLGAFVFYVLGVIGLIVYNGLSYNDSFYISDNDEFNKRLISYKQKLSSMKKNACTASINNLISYYEKTNFTGHVKYSDYFKQGFNDDEKIKFLASFYADTKNACKLSDEVIEKYNFKSLFLGGSIQFDEIMQNNFYGYELNLKDKFFRDIAEPSLAYYEYELNRSSILAIISNLIEISSKDGVKYDE